MPMFRIKHADPTFGYPAMHSVYAEFKDAPDKTAWEHAFDFARRLSNGGFFRVSREVSSDETDHSRNVG